MKEELTKDQAVALHESKFWEAMTYQERATFQIYQPLLCMPFGVFQEAVEKTLGRSVWTHEFASVDELQKELTGEKHAPTLEEIIGLIPKDKLLLIVHTPVTHLAKPEQET